MAGDDSGNGYAADDSSGNNDEDTDSSSSAAPNDICPGFIVDVEKCRDNNLMYSRRKHPKKRHVLLPKSLAKSAPSPIHPDIDISLTHHVMGTDVLRGKPLSAAAIGGAAQCGQMDTLSQLLVDYFGAVRKAGLKARHSSPEPASLPSEASVKSTKAKRSSVRRLHDSKAPNDETPISQSEQKQTDSSVPQIIADIPLSENKATTTFSSQQRRLEEALELTQIPRLLIEAASPHRVVHTNAAFSKSVIKNPPNIQRWIEKQNSSTVPANRSLQQALEDMIPENATVPLSVYPVRGSSCTVSHYLIEASSDSPRKRRRFEDVPSRAIG